MSKVKIVLNDAGVKAFLKSESVVALGQSRASQVIERAGNGYVSHRKFYPERTAIIVSTKTKKALKDTLENNTLLKALK